MRRTADKFEEVQKELKSILLTHGGELFMAFPDKSFEHSGCKSPLIRSLGRILVSNHIGIWASISPRKKTISKLPKLCL